MPNTEHAEGEAVQILDELARFHSTSEYHRLTLWKRFLATDGVKHLADRASAYWLVTAIASHQLNPKVRRRDFQVWRLRRTTGHRAILEMGDDIVDRRCVELTPDGSEVARERPVVLQMIPYTDFPLDTIKLYVARSDLGTVLHLPSER